MKEKLAQTFLQKLGILTSLNLEKICSDAEFTEKIEKQSKQLLIAGSTILDICNKKSKAKFFYENINLFKNADHAIMLFESIMEEFNLSPKSSFETIIEIYKTNNSTQNYIQNIYQTIEKFTSLDKPNIRDIIIANPQLLKCNMRKFYNNISILSTKFKLTNTTLAHIFTNSPLFFTKNGVLSSVKTISKILSLSPCELNYFLHEKYCIFLSPIIKLKDNLGSLIHVFNIDDADTTGVILATPQLLTIPKSNLYSFTQNIMRSFSYPNAMLDKIIFNSPHLVLSVHDDFSKKCHILSNSKIFVKRDLKEIILSAPNTLDMTIDQISQNVISISKYFALTSKNEILKFIRQCPYVISLNNLKDKIDCLKKYNIPLKFVKYNPNLLENQTILTGMKYLILKSFNLELYISYVLNMSIVEIISKLKYLHSNNHNLVDISLSPEIFENKYKISRNEFLQNKYISKNEINEFINIITDQPNFDNTNLHKLRSFFKVDYITQMRAVLSQYKSQSTPSQNKKLISKILQLLGIDMWDANNIAEILYKTTLSQRVVENIELMKKQEFDREQIINLIIKKPTILASSTLRLKDKFNESKNEFGFPSINFYKNI